jgi:hypothetical protein
MLAGVVRMGGRPVAGARVTLEAADFVGATLGALGETYGFIESDVLPGLPPAVQVTHTDAQGAYVLSAWASASKHRYLTAVGPDGATFAGRLLSGGEEQADLELVPAEQDDAALRIRLGGRYQALPIALTVRGEPRAPFDLPAGEDLVVAGLAAGTWKLRARWATEWIVAEQELELPRKPPDEPLAIELPEGAIHGQPAEIRARAGGR